MSIQKCLLDNSSRMIKAMSNAKSSNNEVKTGVQSGLRKIGLAMLTLSIPMIDDKKKVSSSVWACKTFVHGTLLNMGQKPLGDRRGPLTPAEFVLPYQERVLSQAQGYACVYLKKVRAY
ncbi:unnamed protein product [Pieris brassicae]|uniref:Uncharacterized protein n=1 Tax=Pieris brassicae TaxID=7116 RepID=A0A9P0TKY5_PIEBR|nr:unnamed protein product [Pieris brassicae]